MNDIIRLHNGGYNYSIRTSGEVLSVIIREITVLYVSIFFIVQKYNYFLKTNINFFVKISFLTKVLVFVIKEKTGVEIAMFKGCFSFFDNSSVRVVMVLYQNEKLRSGPTGLDIEKYGSLKKMSLIFGIFDILIVLLLSIQGNILATLLFRIFHINFFKIQRIF